MIFVPSIYDLQYYNKPDVGECYCELVLNPSDMALQIQLPQKSGATYSVAVEQWDASGTILLGVVTTSTNWVVFNQFGYDWCNIVFKNFPASMCNDKCFVLRVKITMTQGTFSGLVFDRYTEQYCLDSCCYDDIGTVEISAGSPDGGSIINPIPIDGQYDHVDYDPQDYF